MTCVDFRSLASRCILDLTRGERLAVYVHLLSCTDCICWFFSDQRPRRMISLGQSRRVWAEDMADPEFAEPYRRAQAHAQLHNRELMEVLVREIANAERQFHPGHPHQSWG